MSREIAPLDTAKNMHEDKLKAISALYIPALYNYAFRFCPSAVVADQVVGDILARFLEQLSIGRHCRINLRLDLYAIAYDILVGDARYSNYFMQLETKNLKPADRSCTNLDIEDQQLFENIQQTLRYELTRDQRHVVLLRFVEGFSLKETAVITGKKIGAVKVIQNRGIAALRKTIEYREVETHTIANFIRRMSYGNPFGQ
jgi:RNA polymerase sigma-70 factor, ECF subfamily